MASAEEAVRRSFHRSVLESSSLLPVNTATHTYELLRYIAMISEINISIKHHHKIKSLQTQRTS